MINENFITLGEWARKHGRSRQRAHQIANDGSNRLQVKRFGRGVTLIHKDTPWPEAVKPYGLLKEEMRSLLSADEV